MDIYKIYFDESIPCVRMDWNGYATSRQFREGTEQMLEALSKHRTAKVLADTKNMVLISGEDQDWLTEEFLPKAIQAGFRAIALVKPVHYFNKVAVETIAFKANQEKLRIQFFNDIEEAREWLRAFPVGL